MTNIGYQLQPGDNGIDPEWFTDLTGHTKAQEIAAKTVHDSRHDGSH